MISELFAAGKPALKRLAAPVAPVLCGRPDFLIVGAQKAGTTSLYAYLAEHPGIVPNRLQKELHFFNVSYNRGLAWYLSAFPRRYETRGRLTFEATPDYLWHPEAAERIRQDLGTPKLIAVLREPSARAYSAWKMWRAYLGHPEKGGKGDPRSFAEAIEAELAHPEDADRRHFHYVAMGRYAKQVVRWRSLFPAENLLILDYAEMGRDLQRFLNRICGFLGLGPFDAATSERLGANRLWTTEKRAPTEEEERTLRRLRGYYAPHNETLFDLLGRRFDW